MVGLGDDFAMVPDTRALYRPQGMPRRPELAVIPGGARVA
jgi:hypothetical protein